jgi:hypothetical protein
MFPLMSPDELRDLGEDIKQNGLLSPILLWTYDRLNDDEPVWLLDGRNRLDALEVALGRPVRVVCRVRRDHSNKFKIWTIETDGDDGKATPITNYLIPASVDLLTLSHVLVLGGNEDIDPFAYVISANIHRRHLTTEQKRDLIGKLLQARPAQSNVTIAKQVKVDDKTVAKVRRELEATSEIPKLEKTVGADGKSRPAKRKQRNQGNVEAELAAGRNRIIGEDLAEQEPADQFRPGVAELPAATDVQLLQARISELEAALNQRDIRIAGLEKKVRHLLQVRKAAAADDELSDQCTAKHKSQEQGFENSAVGRVRIVHQLPPEDRMRHRDSRHAAEGRPARRPGSRADRGAHHHHTSIGRGAARDEQHLPLVNLKRRSCMTIPHDAIRDELEVQRRKLANRLDQIIENALYKLVRSIFDEVDACKRLSRARELRDEWEAAVFFEIDELAAALERELERVDAALLQELKRTGAGGSGTQVRRGNT